MEERLTHALRERDRLRELIQAVVAHPLARTRRDIWCFWCGERVQGVRAVQHRKDCLWLSLLAEAEITI